MTNARGKDVDTTYLSVEQELKRFKVHQDYIAHCFRWSHVNKYLRADRRHRTHHVLDVGCGCETPLAKNLYHDMLTHTTGSYTGVDYGPCGWPDTFPKGGTPRFSASFHPHSDFATVTLGRDSYDLIVSFEVLEHVEPAHAFRMLRRMRSLCHDGTVIMLSTPCYDAGTGAAKNHVNEMSRDALRAMLAAAGLRVDRTFGTFANQRDVKPLLDPAARAVYDGLREYYGSNVFATIFAPLYPEASRNCLWVCGPGDVGLPDAKAVRALSAPENGSSERWPSDWARVVREAKRETRRG